MGKISLETLLEYLGERFDIIDQKFARIDERFTLIDERFNMIDKRLGNVEVSIDGLIKRFDEHNTEIATLGYRTDRMEAWIDKAVPKIGIPYKK